MRLYLYILFLFLLSFQPSRQLWGQGQDWITLEYKEKQDHMLMIRQASKLKMPYPDSAWSLLLPVLRASWLERNDSVMAHCLVALSSFTDEPEYMEKALYYGRSAIQMLDTQKQRQDLSAVYDNISKIQFNRSLYNESFQASLKAVQYASDHPVNAAKIESNMIGVLVLLGKKGTAMAYADRSIQVGKKYRNGELWSSALVNKAHILIGYKSADISQVLFYLDSGIRVARRYNQYPQLFGAMLNKSSLLAKNGKPREGILLLEAADTLSRYFAIPLPALMKAYEIKGTAYARLGQFALAEQNFLESIKGTDRHNSLNATLELSRLYETTGDYEKAYHTYKQLREKLDTLAERSLVFQIRRYELQYRTLEKDKQIAENKLLLSAQRHDLKEKNLWMGIFATGGLLLISLVFFMSRSFRHKKKILLAQQANVGLKARIDGEDLERKRIAGELHDGIGGLLSAAKMNLSNMDPIIHHNSPEYERGVQLLDEAYTELRRTAHNLSPHILKSKGLVESLFTYCRKTTGAHGIELKFQHYGLLNMLQEDIVLSTYRIVQELIQNIVKHSGATTAMVQLRLQDDELHIAVEDDGKGIAATQLEEGIGLHNIKDRVKALNGELDIDSRVGEGTAVYISINVKPSLQKMKKDTIPPL